MLTQESSEGINDDSFYDPMEHKDIIRTAHGNVKRSIYRILIGR